MHLLLALIAVQEKMPEFVRDRETLTRRRMDVVYSNDRVPAGLARDESDWTDGVSPLQVASKVQPIA